MSELVFSPCSEAQSQFLLSDAFFTLYGGAAFAGKSFCLLGSILPLIEYPGTRAMVIRKTTKQLSGSGSLFDAAIHLYSKIDPKLKIKSRDLTLKFSTGAELQFTYLDKPADRQNIQGKEISALLLDEAQQLTADNVFYAMSRVRSTRVPYPLQVRATCNPDPDSFLFDFVKFSLDDQLVPIMKEDYPKRYYFRSPAGILWYDSLEEAESAHGKGNETGVKSFLFVPGTIYQNPVGLEQNKDYIATLKSLPTVERKRLLEGAWVREQKSGYFKREWLKFVDLPNMAAQKRVRSWDLAFSEVSDVTPDVDATAGVLVSKDASSVYTIEDAIHVHKRVHEVEKLIFDTARLDGPETHITLPLDPGATAGAYCKDLARRLSEQGYYVRLIRPEKSKLKRFLPFASTAQAGYVQMVRGEWNTAMLDEMEAMDFTNKTHDDFGDGISDSHYHLNRGMTLPDLALGNSTQTMTVNPFQFGSFGSSVGLYTPPLPTNLPTLNF